MPSSSPGRLRLGTGRCFDCPGERHGAAHFQDLKPSWVAKRTSTPFLSSRVLGERLSSHIAARSVPCILHEHGQLLAAAFCRNGPMTQFSRGKKMQGVKVKFV